MQDSKDDNERPVLSTQYRATKPAGWVELSSLDGPRPRTDMGTDTLTFAQQFPGAVQWRKAVGVTTVPGTIRTAMASFINKLAECANPELELIEKLRAAGTAIRKYVTYADQVAAAVERIKELVKESDDPERAPRSEAELKAAPMALKALLEKIDGDMSIPAAQKRPVVRKNAGDISALARKVNAAASKSDLWKALEGKQGGMTRSGTNRNHGRPDAE